MSQFTIYACDIEENLQLNVTSKDDINIISYHIGPSSKRRLCLSEWWERNCSVTRINFMISWPSGLTELETLTFDTCFKTPWLLSFDTYFFRTPWLLTPISKTPWLLTPYFMTPWLFDTYFRTPWLLTPYFRTPWRCRRSTFSTRPTPCPPCRPTPATTRSSTGPRTPGSRAPRRSSPGLQVTGYFLLFQTHSQSWALEVFINFSIKNDFFAMKLITNFCTSPI